MTSFAIEASTKWVGKLLMEEVEFLAKVRDKVESLKTELEWMNDFLCDADHKQYKDARIRRWVSEIRDFSQEAEDIIETYILKVSHKREKARGLIPWSDLKWFFCCLKDATTLHSVGGDLDTLIGKINQLTRRLETYGVKASSDKLIDIHLRSEKNLIEQRRTYAHSEDIVVGLDEYVKNVADKLVSGQQKVVVIHGMGGIGKTTLAREVYNNAHIKSQFVGFAWAHVSQQLQFGYLCKDILLQLIPKKKELEEERKLVQEMQDSQLPTKLYDMLKNSKCFVVLDDIWHVKDWNCLRHCFPFDDQSSLSKILVTSRDRKIFASLSNHIAHYHEARFLSQDKSWELFQKKACFNKEHGGHKVELGEKMLRHCNGHPLAIVVLGGVLATKKTYEEWQFVYDNLSSFLQGDDEYSGVYEVLALSYYVLPYHLKACFLKLGYFPQSRKISANQIYHLWIAEGIVSPVEDQFIGKISMEEIAKGYLYELVQRGMVQAISWDECGVDVEICTVRVHDLMRDKCLELAKAENYLQVLDHSTCEVDRDREECSLSDTLNEKLRRLSIFVGSHTVQTAIPNSTDVPCLRSLLFFEQQAAKHGHSDKEFERIIGTTQNFQFPNSTEVPHTRPFSSFEEETADAKLQNFDKEHAWITRVSQSFQLLRIMDLTEFRSLRCKLPRSIRTLIYLRYLSIKDTGVPEVPSEIGDLRSLLILDLRVSSDVKLSLPNVLFKINSLRQVYLPYQYVMADGKELRLDKKSSLEKIENLNLDIVDEKCLSELKGIRKLGATCSRKKESFDAFLKCSCMNKSLEIKDSFLLDNHPSTLSSCLFLQEVIVKGIVISPTTLEALPQNLLKLHVSRCHFSKNSISVLEKLHRLKLLHLVYCKSETDDKWITTNNGYPELTHLLIRSSMFEELTTKRGSLPKLKFFGIDTCKIERLELDSPVATMQVHICEIEMLGLDSPVAAVRIHTCNIRMLELHSPGETTEIHACQIKRLELDSPVAPVQITSCAIDTLKLRSPDPTTLQITSCQIKRLELDSPVALVQITSCDIDTLKLRSPGPTTLQITSCQIKRLELDSPVASIQITSCSIETLELHLPIAIAKINSHEIGTLELDSSNADAQESPSRAGTVELGLPNTIQISSCLIEMLEVHSPAATIQIDYCHINKLRRFGNAITIRVMNSIVSEFY